MLLLLALFGGAPTKAVGFDDDMGAIVYPDLPEPIVTIRGNGVVEDENATAKKPTGFYELAVCVQTRVIREVATGNVVTEEDYAADLAANPGNAANYAIIDYPFQSVAVALTVNLDVLTPVSWDSAYPEYREWDSTAGDYKVTPPATALYDDYRGIDPNAQDPDKVKITDVLAARLKATAPRRLEAARPDEITSATAQVEHYDPTTKTALITLSAATTNNSNVHYTSATPVIVIRFAYDKTRFPNSVPNGVNPAEFWVGLDVNDTTYGPAAKTPLTYLGASGATANPFETSDNQASMSTVGQSVWYQANTLTSPTAQKETMFYYYLGADTKQTKAATENVLIAVPDASGDWNIDFADMHVPLTSGRRVLTANPDYPAGTMYPTEEYSFLTNLLNTQKGTLVFEYVNMETYRKPTGGKGGIQVLFYDWDDTLIGATLVDGGDVRADINKYVEENFIHPDLRAGKVLGLMGGTVPDYSLGAPAPGSSAETYQKLTDSLERKYTYRGSYPYTPGGPAGETVTDGADFPLTNKLDYSFYRRLHTVTTDEYTDVATGKTVTDTYYTVTDISADMDAAQYPYVYCWAIVEDAINTKIPAGKSNWYLGLDSAKLASTWTTMGVGELSDMDPTAAGTALTTNGATPKVTSTGGFAGSSPTVPATYTYKTSSADANRYLRFADFSDMSAMLKSGQDVLIVKAVYEPGESLYSKGNYTIVPGSLDVRRYSTTSSTENGIYSFAFQYQRVDTDGGHDVGVRRVREPAVKTGFAYDAKSVDETTDLSQQGLFYMKNVADNGEIMNVDITTGGNLWRMEYNLVDLYSANLGTGVNRSGINGWGAAIKENFIYDANDPKYDERQGTDGFVTQLTLYTLIEEASKNARGEDNKLTAHCTLKTLQDLNFKRASGAPPAEFTGASYSRVTGYLRDLAQRIYANQTVWNANIDKNGNLNLGWHQVQQHILMCEAGNSDGIFSGGVLKSEADCIAIGYEWCRLDTCGSNATMPVNSLQDVLKALDTISKGTGDPGYNPAYKAIYGDGSASNTGVAGTDLYGYGFRQDAVGHPYNPASATLKNDIIADLNKAIAAIKTAAGGTVSDWSTVTWDEVQDGIITGNGGTLPANAWWKPTATAPRGTPPAINSWDDLFQYSYLAYIGDAKGKVTDAFDGLTQAALDLLVSEAPPAGTPANLGWFRTGHVSTNASGDEEADKFTVATFKPAWEKALKTLTAAAPTGGGYTEATLKNVPWEEIQYALIDHSTEVPPGPAYMDYTSIMTDPNIDYWWKGGGQPKLTFAKLLTAINDYLRGDSTKIDQVDVASVNDVVYMRTNLQGKKFADMTEFKNTLGLAMVYLTSFTQNGAADFTIDNGDGTQRFDPAKVDEYALQYILIHYNDFLLTNPVVPDKATIAAGEGTGYWWFGGGAPSGPMPMTDIKELMTAYYWYKGTPPANNPNALDNLSAQTFSDLGLRMDDWGIPYAGTLTCAQMVSILDTAMSNLTAYNLDNISSPTITNADLTRELQYALIHNAYMASASITENYWWQGAGYPAPATQKDMLEAAWKAYIGNANGVVPEAETALKAISVDLVNERQTGLALRRNTNGDKYISMDGAAAGFQTAVTAIDAGGLGYTDLSSITQRQLQWMMLGNPYDTDANVTASTISPAGSTDPKDDAYWWFSVDTDPNSAGTNRVEKIIDQTKWEAFMDAARNYYYNGADDGRLAAITATDLKDVYLLRADDSGTEFSGISELWDDSCWDIMIRCVSLFLDYDRGSEFSNNWGASWLKYPSWDEFQYTIINLEALESACTAATYDDARAATESTYDWKYTVQGAKVEITIDQTKWEAFMDAARDYYYNGADDGRLAAITATDLKDVYLLRADDSGTEFSGISELWDDSCWDIMIRCVSLFLDYDRGSEFSNNWGASWLKYPSWDEFQYTIINLEALESACTAATYDDARAATESTYDWKYTT